MERADLERILDKAKKLKIMVVGDYFLDHYLFIDPVKDELSVETGKTAYQVVQTRSTPGAAGTVVNNLIALGVREIIAVGVIGLDGYGYQLSRLLEEQGVDVSNLVKCAMRVTPTYIKPMREQEQGYEELNRLDLKNWSPTPVELEEQIIATLKAQAASLDAIIVADQVEQDNCGVITQRVRTSLAELGKEYPELIIFADSRKNIGKFAKVIIKPNEFEGGRALGIISATESPEEVLRSLFQRSQRSVFLTCGERGQWVYDGESIAHVPAFKVEGPIDIVGAGDSTSAGIVIALASGATPEKAALLGNLVASITITKLGTTGTASPEEILARFAKCNS